MLDGTVNNQVFDWMKNFIRNYASQLPIDSGEYRVGAMTYANTPDGQFQLNQYNFQDEVSNASFGGFFLVLRLLFFSSFFPSSFFYLFLFKTQHWKWLDSPYGIHMGSL